MVKERDGKRKIYLSMCSLMIKIENLGQELFFKRLFGPNKKGGEGERRSILFLFFCSSSQLVFTQCNVLTHIQN